MELTDEEKDEWNQKARAQNKSNGFSVPVTKESSTRPTVCTAVPSDWSCPPYDLVHKTLRGWQPATTDRQSVTTQIKILLEVVEHTRGTERKATVARYIFQLLTANTWFMDVHPKFRTAVQNKLVEFENDVTRGANDIAAEFAWMRQHPFPPTNKRDGIKCAYCGKNGWWTINDGGDSFCTEEHMITFSDNGDCATSDVTKGELDRELDVINHDHVWLLTDVSPNYPHHVYECKICHIVKKADGYSEKDTSWRSAKGINVVNDYQPCTLEHNRE